MNDAFSTYHPAINFVYFSLVLLFTMCLMHPVALLLSLVGGFAWSAYLGGRRAAWTQLAVLLPMLLLMALMNPAFNHRGATILAYLPSGNPLTLESMAYGLAAAAMLAAALLWFSCYHRVMTTDKFVYLFGRVIPALSLVLSMVLRFVPRFRRQLGEVSWAQRCVGRDASQGTPLHRAKCGLRILSILITWSLENAVDTADSMRSRGYGLPGRTAFSLYRLDGRDRAALAWLAGLWGYVLAMCLAGGTGFRYFPTLQGAPWDAWSVSAFVAYGLLCATPLTLDLWEDRTWNCSPSGT